MYSPNTAGVFTSSFSIGVPVKADERGVRQGVAQVLGEPIGDFACLALKLGPESVLAPMRLVGDHDDVSAIGQDRVVGLTPLGCELLDGREHHAPGGAGQHLLQVLPVLRLLRSLSEQIAAHREGAEELVVEGRCDR